MPFDPEWIGSLISVIAVDIVLGGDNAIVIAMACRNLPEEKRKRAIVYGTVLAVALRIVFTLIVFHLLAVPFLQLAGGLLLLWIAYRLVSGNDQNVNVAGGTTMFQAIRTILAADFVMGFDNVIAVAGAASDHVALVVIGLLVSIPIVIGGSQFILLLMEKSVIFLYAGATILALTAGRMISETPELAPFFSAHPGSVYLFWTALILLVCGSGFCTNVQRKRTSHF